MQDVLDKPQSDQELDAIEHAYQVIAEHTAVAHLKAARARLIRARPSLAMHIMHLQISTVDDALRMCRLFPRTVFVADWSDLLYCPRWVTSLDEDELTFVWAQIAYKLQEGWGPDLSLCGRFSHWQAHAFDAVANAWLCREGIGKQPAGAVRYSDITASTDTDTAYDIVREVHEAEASVMDERGRLHVQYDDVLVAQDELSEGHVPMKLKGVDGLMDLVRAA